MKISALHQQYRVSVAYIYLILIYDKYFIVRNIIFYFLLYGVQQYIFARTATNKTRSSEVSGCIRQQRGGANALHRGFSEKGKLRPRSFLPAHWLVTYINHTFSVRVIPAPPDSITSSVDVLLYKTRIESFSPVPRLKLVRTVGVCSKIRLALGI
jgi:hypothetical protein